MSNPSNVDNSLVLNSAINHQVLSLTRHHAANTRHILQTQQRVIAGVSTADQSLRQVEDDLEFTKLDLDSYVESLSLCTTTCKDAMTRSRIVITDLVLKEKQKEKAEALANK